MLSVRGRRAWRDRRGNALILTAMVAMPLILGAGLAVDTTRAMLVRSRLTTAIDAAALAGARSMSVSGSGQTGWQTDATNIFWANFGQTANSHVGLMGAVVTGPTVQQLSPTTIQVSAQVEVPTTFMRVVGLDQIPIRAQSQSTRAFTGLEISLVLDNTGSMAGWPIGAVRTAADELVNVLYGHATDDTQQTGTDSLPNLWLGIVPFTAEVNIGPSRTHWLAEGSYDLNSGAYSGAYDPTNTTTPQWMGCVMARAATGDDFTDTTPDQSPFTPFVYPSTKNRYTVNGKVVPGDDDWYSGHITEASQASLPDNTAVGPNLGCPALPVMGLQPSRKAALNLISQMVATFRGGTFINLGLQAGWWTLSPKWRGLWDSRYPQLPLDYGTPNMKKVIVLMTDGNNEWYDWPGGAPGKGPSPWVNDGDTDYTAYGRLKMNQMGLAGTVSQSNATAQINTRMSQMCTNIKNAGITIYTILFDHGSVSSATQNLFQNCASSPQNYFLTPTASDLETAFTTIGGQLAGVRLSQ